MLTSNACETIPVSKSITQMGIDAEWLAAYTLSVYVVRLSLTIW